MMHIFVHLLGICAESLEGICAESLEYGKREFLNHHKVRAHDHLVSNSMHSISMTPVFGYIGTYLFLQRIKYLSRAMAVIVKALQLRATASMYRMIDSGIFESFKKNPNTQAKNVNPAVMSKEPSKIINPLNLIPESFFLKILTRKQLLMMPTDAKSIANPMIMDSAVFSSLSAILNLTIS